MRWLKVLCRLRGGHVWELKQYKTLGTLVHVTMRCTRCGTHELYMGRRI